MTGTFAADIDQFVQSYERHSADMIHDMLVVYKANNVEQWAQKSLAELQHATGALALSKLPHSHFLVHANDGYDVGSYIDSAQNQISAKYTNIVFIGTTTVIQTDCWLRKMIDVLECEPKTGVVGTCGSYESGLGLPFPNMHIRTGPIFALRRVVFLQCAFTPVRDKHGGYLVEHGPNSLTVRLHNLGLYCFVVGSSGRVYAPREWHHANGYADGDLSEMIATDRHARTHHSPQRTVMAYGIPALDKSRIPTYECRALPRNLIASVSGIRPSCPVIMSAPAVVDSGINPLRAYFDSNQGHLIDKWHHYFDVYHEYFASFRAKASPEHKVVLLEIGVQNGGSLEMWQHYFGKQNCTIYGVDIDQKCAAMNKEDGSIRISIGDQGDIKFLQKLVATLPCPDIIIDDGGHTMQQQILTMQTLFPWLKAGGVFLCEDTHTSYFPDHGGAHKGAGTYIEHSKNIVDKINAYHSLSHSLQPDEWTKNCASLHYYDSMVILRKSKVPIPAPMRSVTGRIGL